MTIDIVDIPNKHGDLNHSYVNLPGRVVFINVHICYNGYMLYINCYTINCHVQQLLFIDSPLLYTVHRFSPWGSPAAQNIISPGAMRRAIW